jgi:hypothetical protein
MEIHALASCLPMGMKWCPKAKAAEFVAVEPDEIPIEISPKEVIHVSHLPPLGVERSG